MPRPNSAEILFILDRSGSMATIAKDMEGGFDTFIAEQKKLAGECKVTLAQFDDHYEVVYESKPIAEVPPLSLVPRGATALLDAIGRTVTLAGVRYAAMKEEARPERVFCVIITDGQENASREWVPREKIFALIEQQEKIYKWDFVFLGADKNAISVAADLGIVRAAQYAKSPTGVYGISSSVSASIGTARSGGGAVVYDQGVYDAMVGVVKPSTGSKN